VIGRCYENLRGRGDDFDQGLLRADQRLSEEDDHTLNARLVLIPADHAGDLAVLRETLAFARRSLERGLSSLHASV
jgi:hypothetical protein